MFRPAVGAVDPYPTDFSAHDHCLDPEPGDVSGDGDIAIAGGASTVNQYLAAGLLDELWSHIAPVTLGAGERLFDGVPPLNLEPVGGRANELVTQVRYRVKH